MAGGRVLREKRIGAVKQSSSWMGFFFKAVPPTSSRGFHTLPLWWRLANDYLIYLQRKTLKNWNSRWFQTTGPQVALPCLPLFTGFMPLLSLQPCSLEGSIESLSRSIHFFSERDEDVRKAIQLRTWFVCLAPADGSGDTDCSPPRSQEKCCTLSRGRPELLLHVNMNPPPPPLFFFFFLSPPPPPVFLFLLFFSFLSFF